MEKKEEGERRQPCGAGRLPPVNLAEARRTQLQRCPYKAAQQGVPRCAGSGQRAAGSGPRASPAPGARAQGTREGMRGRTRGLAPPPPGRRAPCACTHLTLPWPPHLGLRLEGAPAPPGPSEKGGGAREGRLTLTCAPRRPTAGRVPRALWES
jgi:hypothetical protein